LLPVKLSGMAFLTATGGLFVVAFRPLLPSVAWPVFTLLTLAFSGSNWLIGQNGLLLAALFMFGFRWLDARPVLAGFCLGCLAIKPQFGLVLPFALLASGRFVVVASAGATALALIGVSTAVFGMETWVALARELPALHDRVGLDAQAFKLLSVLGATRLLGVPEISADLAQGIATCLACAAAAIAGRLRPDAGPLGAVVCVCALLASPLLHAYDLALLASPLAWLATGPSSRGTTITVIVAFLWVAAWPFVVAFTEAPLTPLILAAVLIAIWRRQLA
jgi:hypothetical protein